MTKELLQKEIDTLRKNMEVISPEDAAGKYRAALAKKRNSIIEGFKDVMNVCTLYFVPKGFADQARLLYTQKYAEKEKDIINSLCHAYDMEAAINIAKEEILGYVIDKFFEYLDNGGENTILLDRYCIIPWNQYHEVLEITKNKETGNTVYLYKRCSG